MIYRYYHLFLLLSVALWVGQGTAEEIDTKVKYVSKSAIYIDTGRDAGVQVGDSGDVYHESNKIARLEVSFVADNSSSCKIREQLSDITVGDSVVMSISLPEIQQEITEIIKTELKPVQIKTDAELISRTRKEEENQFSGRMGIQYYAQDNIDELNYDFSQPSFFLRAEFENIMGSHHTLAARMRGRKNIRGRELSGVTSTKWNNRIYELSLYYDSPLTNYTYGLGRIVPNGVGGLGYMDGMIFNYRLNEQTEFAVFGGTEPDGETSKISSDETKIGTSVSYEKGDYRTQRLRSSVALSGIYRKGKIDREFLYTQNSYSIGSAWSFFQSGELSINRGWRKDSGGSTFQISSFQASARWSPIRSTSFSVGYNNRKSVRTYDTRSIADSLFDNTTRQGFRLSSSLRLPLNFRVSISGNIRTRTSDDASAYSSSAGITFYDQWVTRIRFSTRGSYFSNLYNKGFQSNISLSRNILKSLDLGIEGGYSSYELDQTNAQVKNYWTKINADYRITPRIYSSTYYELYRGSSVKANRLFVEVGLRF